MADREDVKGGGANGRIAWAVAFACLLPLLGFWLYGLLDLDEGYYAASARGMMLRGDWVTPWFAGAPWFEKPILIYWLAIPSIRLFGEAIGPRLPSVLCTLATAWALFAFAKRRLGGASAALAALAYATSLLVVGVGRMMLTDPPLVLALTLALLTFYESLVGDRRMRLWTAALLGVAVLAKGPVALVLFGAVAAITYWRERDLRPAFRGWWLLGTALLLAVVAAWYVPCYLANGQTFVQQFLIEQNVGRFAGGDKAHGVPPWSHLIYYPAVLLVGMAPWSWWALRGRPWKRDASPEGAFLRYLAVWALVVIAFFAVSGSKLPHYAAPACPPLAMLAGDFLARRRGKGWSVRSWLRFGLVWAVVLCAVANAAFLGYYRRQFAQAHELARFARAQGMNPAIFRMGKQDGAAPGVSMKLNETSLPSLLFDLPDAVQTDSIDDLASGRFGSVLTRTGRFSASDVQRLRAAGLELSPVEAPGQSPGGYELWAIERLGGQSRR